MIDETLSHYRIVEKLGAGAMGVVYRAVDERLQRDVAIKVLPAGLVADEPARKGLRREAHTLSRLNHPNIETVHDFDTQEGVDFLVMEYIRGETLAAKLEGGPLGAKEVAVLGAQIAAALEEAHENRVLHRDLKPGNVALTPKGQVKVLDFGLARWLRPGVEATSTEGASALGGTLPYMAPEQFRGEADARSDLFAAGALLYEMATGERCFGQSSGPEVMEAILNRSPRPPHEVNPDVSPELEGVIQKALEKDPAHRYQSATELRVDLERLGAPVRVVSSASAKPKHGWMQWTATAALIVVALLLIRGWGGSGGVSVASIAVLPLENLSGGPDQGPFVDGIHEALIGELGKVGVLHVKSRQTVMRFRDSDLSLPEIGDELGVDALVEGSVQRVGDRVRVSARLVHAPTDRQLWSDDYERDLRDVLVLQSDVARSIARGIEIELTAEEEARLESTKPVEPGALDAYVAGLTAMNLREDEGIRRSIGYFEKAVEIDPDYAQAWAALARALWLRNYWIGDLPPKEVGRQAQEASRTALEKDPTSSDAHVGLGFAALAGDIDVVKAESLAREAIRLNPSNANARHLLGHVLSSMGRHDEALDEIRLARQLDPQNLILGASTARFLLGAGRYDEAVEQASGVLAFAPDFHPPHHILACCYALQGRREDAQDEWRLHLLLRGAITEDEAAAWESAQRSAGLDAGWRELLRTLDRQAAERRVSPLLYVWTYALIGEGDGVIEWLEKAYEDGSPDLFWTATNPLFEPLRDDPRLQDILDKLNLR